ncbi:alpha/beta hydrolase [Saccharopolyspora phatthalungensis]|uniref:S-formylglutathione hydrolase FrmB n=1 Tax=Saccharopolyspora phatthalungensis TaxID=664693 RepID=A0A840QGN8_9PSEU|nr:alpha/beta hydrolase-fold protein [Saccharopolyspora phatthalungensis]MBB5157705.1 S-formylglutathione hydrolase FrmB [Saccharopolyspora phatthalungensis]
MRWIADFCADLSLVNWWPVRALLLAVTLLLLVVLVLRFRERVLRLTLAPLVTVLLAANALTGVNAYFGYYLTISQVLGVAGENQGSLAMINAQTAPPASGVVVAIDIPGLTSGFQARPANVYLPPTWFAKPRPRLPVIVLLHGTPGSPTDWLDGGQAQQTADRWAADHGGVAPIVVMPDVNGTVFGDTECVDSPRGKAETYLTSDVPRFLRSRFLTRDPGRDWAVAGLSEGGSCAIMLALRHPDVFATFADFGGLLGPRDGDTNDPAGTPAALFGGSQQDFDAHEPAWLLSHRRFPDLHGFFVVGDNDPEPFEAVRQLAELSHRAGIATEVVVIPGGEHTFDVWSTAFANAMPWIAHRLGR